MTQDDFIGELRRVVATVKHYVEEQLELGLTEPKKDTAASKPKPSPQTAEPVSKDDRVQGFLELPRKPNPFEAFSFDQLAAEASRCERCPLHQTRTNVVFGAGNLHAELMFVGEAPGHDEDLQGEPFVGRAGQLLTKIIEAMGLAREDVYICNVLKCRPPENRNPLPDEMQQCEPFLQRQMDLVKPKIIVGLGTFAVQRILQTAERISRLRGRFHEVRGIRFMPTYHPAFLLRNPNFKREVWEDMKQVMEELKTLREGGSGS